MYNQNSLLNYQLIDLCSCKEKIKIKMMSFINTKKLRMFLFLKTKSRTLTPAGNGKTENAE